MTNAENFAPSCDQHLSIVFRELSRMFQGCVRDGLSTGYWPGAAEVRAALYVRGRLRFGGGIW